MRKRWLSATLLWGPLVGLGLVCAQDVAPVVPPVDAVAVASPKSVTDPAVGASESEDDFVRFRELGETTEGRRGRLETALATYERDDGARVDLIGAVHVGDTNYYAQLQRRFATYDRLLYELIKPDDLVITPGSEAPLARGGGMLSALQRGLKNLLDLDFQLDAIDYRRANFVHADVSPDQFMRLQRERGESFFTLFFRLVRAELARQEAGEADPFSGLRLLLSLASSDRAGALKWALASELKDMERMMAGLEAGEQESVIVVARNKVALRRLREVLGRGHKRVGIFYGAAHMPDMARRLVEEFGFWRTEVVWLSAWDIHQRIRKPTPRGDSPPPPRRDSGEGSGAESAADPSEAKPGQPVKKSDAP